MNAQEECKHLLLASACGDCREPVRRTQPVPRSGGLGPWFSAGFAGDCDGCGDLIDQGDQIRSDGMGGWLCRDCGMSAEDE